MPPKVSSVELTIIQTVIVTEQERIVQHWGTGANSGKVLMQSVEKLQPKAQGQPAQPALRVAPSEPKPQPAPVVVAEAPPTAAPATQPDPAPQV